MDKKAFNDFFKPYVQNVAGAQELPFWQLSNDIIEKIVNENILAVTGEDDVVLDAGGGTGWWSVRFAAHTDAQFMVYDLSGDMLEVAEKNILASQYAERISQLQGDLTNMSAVADESFSHAYSIYSPISFIYEPEKAIKELFRVLKPGGKLLIMAHSYHNALASKINNYQAPAEELLKLADTQRVAWASHVPELVTHSQESLESLCKAAGFNTVRTYGVPVYVQPGPEDFNPDNEGLSNISAALQNQDFYNAVLEIEMRHNAEPTVANRGVNTFTLVQKPE